MINFIQGDICTVEADIIVNAANAKMLGGGGVDGAIHRAAGPKLVEACRKVKSVDGIRCPAGEARITGAFDLPAKFVVHTVGPRYKYDKNPAKVLRSAYNSSLSLAKENGAKSIVFPAISCGVYAYPIRDAAEIALSECLKDEFSELEISFCLFRNSDLFKFKEVYEKLTV